MASANTKDSTSNDIINSIFKKKFPNDKYFIEKKLSITKESSGKKKFIKDNATLTKTGNFTYDLHKSKGDYFLNTIQGKTLSNIRVAYIHQSCKDKPYINIEHIYNLTRESNSKIKGLGVLFMLYIIPIFFKDVNDELELLLKRNQINYSNVPKDKINKCEFDPEINILLNADPFGGEELIGYYKKIGYSSFAQEDLMVTTYNKLLHTYLSNTNITKKSPNNKIGGSIHKSYTKKNRKKLKKH